MRKEFDSMGEILVSDDVYWGAQTQRSIENFKISSEIDMLVRASKIFLKLTGWFAHLKYF